MNIARTVHKTMTTALMGPKIHQLQLSWHQFNFPMCDFLKTLDAVNTMESMMPTTVKVPPTIAQTC